MWNISRSLSQEAKQEHYICIKYNFLFKRRGEASTLSCLPLVCLIFWGRFDGKPFRHVYVGVYNFAANGMRLLPALSSHCWSILLYCLFLQTNKCWKWKKNYMRWNADLSSNLQFEENLAEVLHPFLCLCLRLFRSVTGVDFENATRFLVTVIDLAFVIKPFYIFFVYNFQLVV